MAKKRKIATVSSQSEQLPPQPVEKKDQFVVKDPEELKAEEVEYEEVGYDEEGEESEDEGGDGDAEEDNDQEDLDGVSLPSIVASFSKETLVTLLSEAAERHSDVATRVRESAEADPAQRKIFVHGLKWDTTTETLLKEFSKYGEIDDCRVVTDKTSGKSKGYGFILFKSTRGAREALKEPKKTIDGRMTSSQMASLGSLPPQKPRDYLSELMANESEYTQRKIYVSNVGEDVDPTRLTSFFLKYGEIEEGPLGLDKETGKPKGFCLFVYKTVESAKKALAEPHKHFEGVFLHCQKAIDGPKSLKKQMIQNLSNKNAAHSQQFTTPLAPNLVGSTPVPAPVQGNFMPPMVQQQQQQQQQGLNLNPSALGQALTTLMAAQGAGLNLFGALGNPPVVPSLGNQLVHGDYRNQAVGISGQTSTGVNELGAYGNQGHYPNQYRGRGGAGRSHRGGRPYRGGYA